MALRRAPVVASAGMEPFDTALRDGASSLSPRSPPCVGGGERERVLVAAVAFGASALVQPQVELRGTCATGEGLPTILLLKDVYIPRQFRGARSERINSDHAACPQPQLRAKLYLNSKTKVMYRMSVSKRDTNKKYQETTGLYF